MKKKTRQLLHLKRHIIWITGLLVVLCTGIFAAVFILTTKTAYSEILTLETENSETGMRNAKFFFEQRIEEICQMNQYLADQYENAGMAAEDFGFWLERFDLSYCGVVRQEETGGISYIPWNISQYSFSEIMREFMEKYGSDGNIHFFAHNFSNSRNGIVMTHCVVKEGLRLMFVYQLESEFYWSDYTDNSLRNGYFIYDSALEEIAPSKTSFVNLNDVLEELKAGKEKGSMIFQNGAESRVVSYILCEDRGVYLFNSIPVTSFDSFVQQQFRRLFPWYLLTASGIAGTAYLYYRRVFRPVLLIGEALSREVFHGKEQCTAEFPESSFSPVMDLVKSLEEKIFEAKEREYKERLLKEQAELINLQSQINPHFMYNTLESIRAMSALEGEKKRLKW